jgi:hypothetical protein
MTRKRSLLATIALVVLIAVVGTATSAGATDDAGNQLAGAWQSTVNPPAPQQPVHSLQVYTADGGWVETSNQAPTTRSAMYGSWERIDGRRYAATGVHFLFDPQTGAFLGKRKINRTFQLAQDGSSFSGVAHVTTYDPNGNVAGSFVARASADRMDVERLPDQP